MKLKTNCSYLIKYTQWTGQSPNVEKITVLTTTRTCYEIQWENTKTWEEIAAFDSRVEIVEELGEVKKSESWEETLKKLKKQLEPFEGDILPPRRDPYRPWIRPWKIDDPKPYWPTYPPYDWWRITCGTQKGTVCLRDGFGIIAKDPEHPATAWFRGHAEKLKREGY